MFLLRLLKRLFGKKEVSPVKKHSVSNYLTKTKTIPPVKPKENEKTVPVEKHKASTSLPSSLLDDSESERVIMPDDRQGERLGTILLKYNMITYEKLHKALKIQAQANPRKFLGEVLIDEKMLSEENLVSAISRQFKIPYVQVNKYTIPKEIIKLIPYETAKKNLVIPLHKIGQVLTLGMVNPQPAEAVAELEKLSGCKIKFVICKMSEVRDALKVLYESGPGSNRVVTGQSPVEKKSQNGIDDTKVGQPNLAVSQIPFPKPPAVQNGIKTTVSPAALPADKLPTVKEPVQSQSPHRITGEPRKEIKTTPIPVVGKLPKEPVQVQTQTAVTDESQKKTTSLTEDEFNLAIKEITINFIPLWEQKYHREKIIKAEQISEEEFEFSRSCTI